MSALKASVKIKISFQMCIPFFLQVKKKTLIELVHFPTQERMILSNTILNLCTLKVFVFAV